jgi:L-seryl-tRNA(Ser) seleniumtransferase
VRAIRTYLDELRARLADEADSAPDVPSHDAIASEVARRVAERDPGIRRVINATGVVLHTNLGRARLAPEAVAALVEVARGACDLEFDLETGKRSRRGRAVEIRLTQMTGAEAALVVNNNAGALVLALNEIGQGKEAIVSRGELVEIGGSFRIPDVMARTGAKLVEVGTTNRTHARDYENAIGPDTAILLKVHRSNFRQEGFVSEPPLEELVAIGRKHGIPVLHDLGSGSLHEIDATRHEPGLMQSLESGVDLLTFSGDKLLGGPQAGILLGKRVWIDRLRSNPLARALRIDKFTIAALAATLDLLEDASEARSRVPVLAALGADPEELAARASRIASDLGDCRPLSVRVEDATSEVGGGAVPAEGLPTTVVALTHETRSANELARELRQLSPPVIARVAKDRVLLDPRSMDPSEDRECSDAIRRRFGPGGGR